MVFKDVALGSIIGSMLLCATGVATAAQIAAHDNTASSTRPDTTRAIAEVVVTAQKIKQNINDVGMSIQASSGDELRNLGITDTGDLVKIVPGFHYNPTGAGTPIYSMRGVGFQTTAMAVGPAVSVYVDQFPLPYSIMSTGASLDAQRVEVLKGPQGTLYGENSTGGLINYIANKPTDNWQAGYNASYSRFNTINLDGYVSGPITDGLDFRVAARSIRGDDWQYSYTHPATAGRKKLLEYRASLRWEPTDQFTALFTASGFQDRGDTQMQQFFGPGLVGINSGVDPRVANYPIAPHDPRAADWGACVNTSPLDPPFGTTPLGAPKPTHSTICQRATNDNTFWKGNLRMDYHFDNGVTLTSLTQYANFTRHGTALDGGGTIYQIGQTMHKGYIHTTYQELRVSGDWFGNGHWMVGTNYEFDDVTDNFVQSFGSSNANPTAIPGAELCGIAYDCTGIDLTGVPPAYLTVFPGVGIHQVHHKHVYAAYVNADYPIFNNLTLQAGARYTQTNLAFEGCEEDNGSGLQAILNFKLQNFIEVLHGTISPATYLQPGAFPGGNAILTAPGECVEPSTQGPDFHPELTTGTLNEHNASWRVGLNWNAWESTLLYVNASRGFKGGAYPTLTASTPNQYHPVIQESLLAYEAGFKSTLFEDTLQLNGAVFYYDYKNKQLRGADNDPVFGPLATFVNVPKSHIAGYELSANWQPVQGLSLRPNVSYITTRVDGCEISGPNCINGDYYNYDTFTQFSNLTGESFPMAPKWQVDIDAEYQWPIRNNMTAFVGTNINYQGGTNSEFYNRADYPANNLMPPHVLYIRPYTLVDVRAGVKHGDWRVQFWGRNIFNKYYLTNVGGASTLAAYTGMPATFGVTISDSFQ